MKNILVIVFFTFISCNKNNDVNPGIPEDFINKSLELFNGSIIERESETENGIDVWEVKIRRFFDYKIALGTNLIKLTTALTLAKTVMKDDKTL